MNFTLHAVFNGEGRPVAMLPTEGQMSDHKAAALLLPEQMLELGKDVLDGVQVGRGWQEQEPGPGGADGPSGCLAPFGEAQDRLVAAEIVEDDDIAGRERRYDALPDPGGEGPAVGGRGEVICSSENLLRLICPSPVEADSTLKRSHCRGARHGDQMSRSGTHLAGMDRCPPDQNRRVNDSSTLRGAPTKTRPDA